MHTAALPRLLLVAGPLVLVPRAGAQSWNPPLNLGNGAGTAVLPEIAADFLDGLHLVWVERSTAPQEIRYAQRPRGGAWTAPVAIATFPGTSQFADGEPRVAVGFDGTVHVVFADDTSGSSEISHLSKPLAGSWSPTANVSRSPGMRSEFPDLKVTLDGTVHVAWIDSRDFTVCCSESFYANLPPGGAWSTPLNISNTTQNQYPQRMAAGLDGTVHVVWTQQDSFPSLSNLYHVERSPAGVWSLPLNLTGAVAGRGITDLLVGSDLSLHALYHEAPGEILLLTRSPTGAWGTPLNLSNDTYASWNGALAEDAAGILHCVWQDDFGGGWGLVHAFRTPAGSWSPRVPVTFPASGSEAPRLAATSTNLHAAWQQAFTGGSDVLVAEGVLATLDFVGTPRAPNPVHWALRNGFGRTGHLVLVLISCTGTQGIPLPDGRLVPLTFDACTRLGLAAVPLFVGFLDGAGNAATPAFPFPVLAPGLPIWSAAVLLDPATLQFGPVTTALQTVTQ